MAVIGDLKTILSVNSTGLVGGLGKGASAIGGFGSKVAGLAGMVAPIGGALAVLTSAIKGVTEVGQAFGDIDRIAKAADSFGITTEEMVGLEHAAELSGVSTEALGKAMQRATRQGMDLADIADQLAGMSDPAERAAFAYKTLGRQGQDLIPLLAAGGDAIREMMAEGNDLAGFDRLDAGKVEAANDAISRMKLAFTGVARDLAISLAPTVERIAVGVKTLGQWFRDAFARVTPIIEQTGNVLASLWEHGIALADVMLGGLISNFGSVQSTFATAADAILNGLIAIEFGFTNLDRVAALTWEKLKLGAFTFAADFQHLFMVQLPAAVKGFAANIGKLLPDLWDFIRSGGQKGDLKGLLQSFQDGLVETMAGVPERALTPFEQKTKAKLAKMEGALAGDLAEFMQQRRDELLGTGETTAAESPFHLDFEGAGIGKRSELQGVAALERGSGGAFSAILSAMRGNEDPQQQLAETAEQQLAVEQQVLVAVKKLASTPPVQLIAGSV